MTAAELRRVCELDGCEVVFTLRFAGHPRRFCSRPHAAKGMRRGPRPRPRNRAERVCALDGCEVVFELARPGDPKRFCSREHGLAGQARRGRGRGKVCRSGRHPMSGDNVVERVDADGVVRRRCRGCMEEREGRRPVRPPRPRPPRRPAPRPPAPVVDRPVWRPSAPGWPSVPAAGS